MKKIQLKKFNLSNAELLSKEQMKNVLGKMMGGSGDDGGKCTTDKCSYVTIQGNVYEGKCESIPAGPMSDAKCGCAYGNNTQEANECYAK